MKETYLSRDFRETAAQCFPSQAKELNAFFDARLNVLLAENADASKEKQYHLQRQILPGVAAYETLQRVMPKEEALQTVHGYVEELARTSHKQLAALLHIPGLYRLVPGVFVKSTRSVFGPAAGFDSKELQVGNGIWRVDIATTLLPETENKRRSSYRLIADTSFFSYFLGQHRTIWQAHSVEDFASYESYKRVGILYVETVKKPRRRCPGQSSGGCVRGAKSPPRVQSTGF